MLPMGVKLTSLTLSVKILKMLGFLPTLQIPQAQAVILGRIRVVSQNLPEPEATRRPSGLTATVLTAILVTSELV